MILSGASFLAIGVTLLCIILHKGSQSEGCDEYERYLDDHIYYDKTAIRYRKGILKEKNEIPELSCLWSEDRENDNYLEGIKRVASWDFNNKNEKRTCDET